MTRTVRSLLFCTLVFCAGANAAFKCTQPDGSIVYQDKRCDKADQSKEVNPYPSYAPGDRFPRSTFVPSLPERVTTPVDKLPIGLEGAELVTILGTLLFSVTVSLKDPQSAIFKYVCLQRGKLFDKEYYFLSGFINAKNSYGGYVGDKNFYALYDGSTTLRGSYDNPLDVYIEHNGRKWMPQIEYFVCSDHVDDSIVAQAARRTRGASGGD